MESNISKLLQLEHNCRNCESIKELYFQIVNETRNLVNYSQGVLLTTDLTGKYKVVAISDISVVDSTSPYVQWIEEIVIDFNNNEKSKDIFIVEAKNDLKEINYNETIIIIKYMNNYLKEQLEIELQKENIILNSTSSLIIEDNAK
ncbi:MAG: hypothetical protein IE890_06915, partial [Arcobacter sp.]|nr:hypothetical protein [Arcobacter sp.]